MSTVRRNIELKARFGELARGHEAAQRLGAVRQADQHQIDTYFHCTRGRLKLREIVGGESQLIAYARPDHAEAKASDYILVAIPQPAALKEALAQAQGQWLVVDKKRAIYLWENVRIHLDEVAGLGNFLEFEAVLGEGHTDEQGHAQLRYLSGAFGVTAADLLTGSYSDLLARRSL